MRDSPEAIDASTRYRRGVRDHPCVRGGTVHSRTRASRASLLAMAGIAAVAVLAAPASGLAAPRTRLGTPPRGSGIGTSAALQNPKCTAGDAYGRYGRFPGFTHAAQGT